MNNTKGVIILSGGDHAQFRQNVLNPREKIVEEGLYQHIPRLLCKEYEVRE